MLLQPLLKKIPELRRLSVAVELPLTIWEHHDSATMTLDTPYWELIDVIARLDIVRAIEEVPTRTFCNGHPREILATGAQHVDALQLVVAKQYNTGRRLCLRVLG